MGYFFTFATNAPELARPGSVIELRANPSDAAGVDGYTNGQKAGTVVNDPAFMNKKGNCSGVLLNFF